MAIMFFDCSAFKAIRPLGETQSEAGGQQHGVLDYGLFNWQIVQFGLPQSIVVEMLQNRKEARWEPHCHLSYSLSAQQASDSAQAHVISRVIFYDSFIRCGCVSKGREERYKSILKIRTSSQLGAMNICNRLHVHSVVVSALFSVAEGAKGINTFIFIALVVFCLARWVQGPAPPSVTLILQMNTK